MSELFSIKPPVRGAECPPPVVLEAVSAGEDPGEPTRRHVEGCAECGGYVHALRQAQEDFNRMWPAEQFVAKLDRRSDPRVQRTRPWLVWLGGLVAAGLAVAVLAPTIFRDHDQPKNDVLIKGGGGLVVVYRRGATEAPQPVQQDARLKRGDALRFSYGSDTSGHLLILDLDGTGRASVFYPYASDRSAPVAADDTEFLPGSVVLDDAPGPEWIVAVFSARPLEAQEFLEQLRSQRGSETLRVSCEGCKVTTLRIQKTP